MLQDSVLTNTCIKHYYVQCYKIVFLLIHVLNTLCSMLQDSLLTNSFLNTLCSTCIKHAMFNATNTCIKHTMFNATR